MAEVEPEIGQACFGQPHQEHETSELLMAALSYIKHRLSQVMWNIHQEEYESPFENTGNRFDCETFKAHAYSWNEDEEQPWNFKWRDVEVSWYKYLGRGMSANQDLTPRRIDEMLNDCLTAIHAMDQEEVE